MMQQCIKTFMSLVMATGLHTQAFSTDQENLDRVESSRQDKRVKLTIASTHNNEILAQPTLLIGGWMIIDLFFWLDGQDFIRAARVYKKWRATAY